LSWYVRESVILLIKICWGIIRILNCENGWLGTDVDFVDNLGYAKLEETQLKFLKKKKHHEFLKYIAGKLQGCYN
jgi:hypothetical protein